MQVQLDAQNVNEVTMLVAEVVEQADQTASNVGLVRRVVVRAALLVSSNPAAVDEVVRTLKSCKKKLKKYQSVASPTDSCECG